jgi:hypothetical protein
MESCLRHDLTGRANLSLKGKLSTPYGSGSKGPWRAISRSVLSLRVIDFRSRFFGLAPPLSISDNVKSGVYLRSTEYY